MTTVLLLRSHYKSCGMSWEGRLKKKAPRCLQISAASFSKEFFEEAKKKLGEAAYVSMHIIK